jgi:drug/metabolite transporter (DMT)-like permease
VSSLPLGVAAAFAASALYNLGVALQALEARATPPEHAMQLSLIGRLLRRPRWLAGTLLGVLGWPLHTVALLLAPLTVVQPALALGLMLLLAVGARSLHERVGPREIGAVVAIIAGVALLSVAAPAANDSAHAPPGQTAAVLGAIALLALAPFVASARRRIGGLFAALGAGAAFAWSGLSTKYVADAAGRHAWVMALVWGLATGLASGLALISEMTALQQRRATQVAPLVFVLQVVVPVLAAPLLVGEQWVSSAPRALGVCGGLAIVLAGAVALVTSPTVTAFIEPAAQVP